MDFSVEDVMARREALLKIINQFKKDGKTVTRFSLQPALKEVGYDVSYSTIYRDMTILNRENTWVRDLVESNYSAYQEHIHDTLNMIEKEALKMYQEKPTIIKKTHKEISKNGEVTIIEEANTEEVANMTVCLLELILKVQSLRMKQTHGDNINVSAALLTAELREAQDKLENMNKEPRTPIVDVIKLAKQARQYMQNSENQ